MEFVLILTGLAAAHLMAAISPGPTFVVVAQLSVAASRRAGLASAVGAGVGATVWAAAALFGLKAVFLAVPWLYTVLKIAGAAYLIYIAWKIWRHADDPLPVADAIPGGGAGRANGFRKGLVTQLSNPKPAVFFGSVFITLIPAGAPFALYGIVLANVLVIETLWYGFVAYALTLGTMKERYRRLKGYLDRLTGAVLAGLGVKLILDR